jgi:hypothetical protein
MKRWKGLIEKEHVNRQLTLSKPCDLISDGYAVVNGSISLGLAAFTLACETVRHHESNADNDEARLVFGATGVYFS